MSTPTDLSIQLADLPAPVAEAVRRAAKRIDEATQQDIYASVKSDAIEIITEELRPVLLGGPLPVPGVWSKDRLDVDPLVAPRYPDSALPSGWIVAGSASFLPQRQGCIGTRYCHACKVSYGGTCLCVPNKCHHCGAECGTSPPAEGERYTPEAVAAGRLNPTWVKLAAEEART